MWIATVQGMDWPAAGAPVASQQAQIVRLLDVAKAMNFNTVFFQVRPSGDALYPSPYEPWSQWLTGTAGRNPGWDPLGFLVTEAHRRDLEVHAWFNPYRVSMGTDRSKLPAGSPARAHPDWVVTYGGNLWYDPGIPQVRDLVSSVVLDVVGRYDIDGVHFDDYFYPYPSGADFPDGASYKKYGSGGRAAWRRQNVDTLVKSLSQRIHAAKSWVKFGISPFGVWRNASSDPAGSATHALQSFDDIYADSRLWIRRGWVDYITPQLYWPIGDARADYRTLVAWWARQVQGTGVQLTIGESAYRVGQDPDPVWNRPAELPKQVAVDAGFPAVRGEVFFSARDVAADRKGFASRLRAGPYRVPAIVPVIAGRGGAAPAAPSSVTAVVSGKAVRVSWRGGAATSYAVYRVPGAGPGCAPVDPRDLLVTVRATGISDATAKPGVAYTYYVTALDRLHHESAPARGATVVVKRSK
jgi:uncharacterized lipoprotein YddW (UPF0748 family)